MEFQEIVETVGRGVDAAGVVAIVVGAALAVVFAIRGLLRREDDVYSRFRRFLGRSILLGLELLVAADIIRTVAVTPTLDSVAVLAAIVLIRDHRTVAVAEAQSAGCRGHRVTARALADNAHYVS
jgi:uncharacterized membrane protein